jgi:hypothetical protein
MRTPGVFLIRVYGNYSIKGRRIPLDVSWKPELVLGAGFKLPLNFHGAATIFGKFSVGVKPTLKNALEQINQLRKPEGLEPLPDGVVCEKVDLKAIPPAYTLSLSVLPTPDPPTDPD